MIYLRQGSYNVVVIGAGPAGLVTAAGTAALGGRVALVERSQMGGDCLNFGCVPSKALISSARLIQNIRRAHEWGLKKQDPLFEFSAVFARMRARRARIAVSDSQERFESLGVDVYRGESARFVSPHEVEVGGRQLRAHNFVIATGSRGAFPNIRGLEKVPHFTNETIFDKLPEKPETMIVLGGGPIGCELGQTLSRLGVKVTLVECGPQILGQEDADVAGLVQSRLEAEGMSVNLCMESDAISTRDGVITLEALHKPPGSESGRRVQFNAEALLLAAGRVPNVQGLNLEAAGVNYSNQGIEVNSYMQTSQPHIYAAGDVTGRYKFTHTADFAARAIVRNILVPFQFLRRKVDDAIVPWCTYTDPEVAHVGLCEREAKKAGIAYDLFVVTMDELDRAIVEREDAGFAKVLTRKGNDKLLGVTVVASHAGDLLHEFVLAMNAGIGLGKIASTIHAYPTFAELARKAADKYNKGRLTQRTMRLFGWLYDRALNNIPDGE